MVELTENQSFPQIKTKPMSAKSLDFPLEELEAPPKVTENITEDITEELTIASKMEAEAVPSPVELAKKEATPKEEIKEEVKPELRPARYTRKQPFRFMEDDPLAAFDYLSYKQHEQGIDMIVNDYNKGVYDRLKTVDEIGANEYIDKNNFGYQALRDHPELLAEIDAMPPVSMQEQWEWMDKWGIVPYLGDVSEVTKNVRIFGLIQKDINGVPLSPEETQDITNFMLPLIHISRRGVSWQAKVLQGVYRLPAFMGEFATTGGILKGLLKVGGGKVFRKALLGAMKPYMKGKISRGLIKAAAGGAARTVFNPISVYKNFTLRRVNDSFAITDKGEAILMDAKEAPATTFIKATFDVWTELASETLGLYAFKPVGRNMIAKLPAGLRSAFSGMVKAETGLSVRSALRRYGGFDGILEELGEERAADFLRVALNLDPEEGYSFSQFGEALFPSFEDWAIELGIISTGGVMSRSTGMLLNRLGREITQGRPTSELTEEEKKELLKIVYATDSLSENQRQNLLDTVTQKETEAERLEFEETRKGRRMELEEAGMASKEIEAVLKYEDALITTTVGHMQRKGKDITRLEFARELPGVVRAETGEGLGQADIKKYKKEGALLISPRFMGDKYGRELFHKLGIMYGNELRLTAMEQQATGFKKSEQARIKNLEGDLDVLVDEIIDEIKNPIQDWLDGHGAESPTTWVDRVVDESGEMGEPLLKNDGTFTMGGVGGQQTIDVGSQIVEKFNEEMATEMPSIKEIKADYEKGFFKGKEDYEIEDQWREDNPDDIPPVTDFSELSDMFGGVEGMLANYELKQIIRDVLETDGYTQWYEGGAIDADVLSNMSEALAQLTSADNARDKIKAIDRAVNLQHHTGAMADMMDLTNEEMETLSKIGEFAKVKGFEFDPDKLLYQRRRGAYDPIKNLYVLLPGADRSTFLHESAHFFMEYYLKNMPEELGAVFDWVGIKQKPLSELSEAEYKKLQESFANGFEIYIMEGKAPNSQLAEIFQTFKDWLMEIYESISSFMKTGEYKLELSDSVRQVYTDMLNFEAQFEGDIRIDTKITPELKAKALTLYQEAKQKIEELKKKRKEVKKKYGKKAKADLAEVDQAIKDLETITVGIKRADVVKEAEAAYEELPVSQVIEDKIRITPEYEEMMKRYDIPANVKTTDETKKTLDEWSTDLEIPEDAILEDVARIRSRSKYVSDYVAREAETLREEMAAEKVDVAEVQKKLGVVIDKLKEDAKKGDITELQKEVITTIREMKINDADKVKFLGQIQKAKTPYSQRKVLQDMLSLEQKYWEKQQRNILDIKIQKMLKQTKPKAERGIVKGRFEYENNKFFIELREINKLNQKEALAKAQELRPLPPDEVFSNEEILLRAFTNYKAFGKSKGTLELFESVHEGLRKAIAFAKESKDQKDFEDKLEKREQIKGFLAAVNKMKYKGDSKSLTTKILNVYRTGTMLSGANMWSLINSIAGKNVADQLNLEHPELTRDTHIYYDVKDTVQQAVELLELKSETDFFKMIDQYNSEEYTLIEKDPRYEEEYIARDFTRMGIIDIYNAIKNEKTRADYYRVYGENEINELVERLSEKEEAFADMLMDKAQEMREEVNKIHVQQTGVDLGIIENYWPATSVKPQSQVNDNLVNEVVLATFQKQRVKAPVTPIPVDAWRKLSTHLSGQYHVIDVMQAWRDTRKILDSETIKNKIERKYSKDVYRTLIAQVNALSLVGLRDQSNVVNSFLRGAFKNWVKAKISLNPSVFMKQLISLINYTENIPVADWLKYFAEGMANPAETKQFMFRVSKYLEARYSRGYSEDINRALAEGKKLARSKSMNKVLTSLVRMGDIGAIVYGGYPMIRYLQEKEGLSLGEAVKKFELATVRSQQSGLASSLDLAQQSKNPFMNFFFAFKNTPKQYMRKITDALIMYYNGDITATELSKILTIYMFMQPAMFGVVTQLMRSLLYDDEDDYLDDVAGNILTSYTNAFPVLGEMNRYMVQYIIAEITGGRKPWKMFNQPLLSDLEMLRGNAIKAMKKGADEMTIFDLLGVMGTPLELTTGLPIQTMERPFKKRLTKTEKKTKL